MSIKNWKKIKVKKYILLHSEKFNAFIIFNDFITKDQRIKIIQAFNSRTQEKCNKAILRKVEDRNTRILKQK